MKCGTTSCTAVALYLVHWPGKPISFCRPCAFRAVRIADAMGFPITADPILSSTPTLALAVLIYPDTDEPERTS